jgi:hypothetical protein
MTNQETVNAKRAAYINHDITHEEYYCWLADFVGLTDGMIPVSNKRIQASTDIHLNDILLHTWDSCDWLVRSYAYGKRLAWSLSDTTCCLKALARRRQRRVSGQPA